MISQREIILTGNQILFQGKGLVKVAVDSISYYISIISNKKVLN